MGWVKSIFVSESKNPTNPPNLCIYLLFFIVLSVEAATLTRTLVPSSSVILTVRRFG